ncbi:Crp/Fnr family transcriptional regulator [Pseudoramibacter sp.]|jgi:CRP-like cAMP-binding protein|uniref:Crp/Fnr family transcriptional regulator n=1 Tax=Pseudoramibacter sp. TaxID=2034862 RepID=UPI0025FD26FF|nr:Crp/Fnr family transcriptional regulator [Pseudoramibacter sp.]MCH4071424.1 Crp/Fnr family transcriptional regulator [Pseudoramibacter sp.]MCH4105192.1 Crp/Fnr family transcriptional regulator [Pseudoramibacter sp.]
MISPALIKSPLFRGLSAEKIQALLENTPHFIQHYDKGDVIFLQMDTADRIGIVLEGQVQAEKTFPNGSMVNVTARGPGNLVGPGAAFSKSQRYPCDVIAAEPAAVMIMHKEDLLALMQKDRHILQNFITELSTATYTLQQRIELFSYSGICQKAAFWLLLRRRQTGKNTIPIPESVTNWALLMNVSRPSLYRELKKMEKRGFIRYSPKQITILDAEGLQDMLSAS